MKVLIVGSGGREHALAWKLKQSPLVSQLYIAPGNGGTMEHGENAPIKDDDLPGLTRFAQEKSIDLVVTGPELPLVLGLRDALDAKGIPCFGPTTMPAQLEGSKAFAKKVMREAGVPTADCRVFESYAQAAAYVKTAAEPLVIKADGLAAGKGVLICATREEALLALDEIMVRKVFGLAGSHVVVEQCLSGQEASFLAFCDGENVALLPSSQDHKPVGEGDTGPNTGGMGAYSPAPILPEADYERVADLVIRPIVRRMAEMGSPFTGILYAGLMIRGDDINVLEYNVRFGDPEAQPLLMRLESDLAEIMLACVEGRLKPSMVVSRPETSICVVMASGGYPGAYAKGKAITGIDQAERLGNVKVFHAGTRVADNTLVTSGGRVLGVTALGLDLASARKTAYQAVSAIHFDNAYYRRDIGDKGLKVL